MSQEQLTENSKPSHVSFDFEYKNLPPKGAKKKVKWVDRKIVTGRPDLQLKHNGISTSKYNFATFIPLNLMEQFSKIANIYFLAIGIMQSITEISVTNGTPDIFVPLFFIVIISALKDLVEDIKRHRSDKDENSKICTVLDPYTGKFEQKQWQKLRVGEIVKIEKNEYVPADLLLLLSSSPKGEAFIETKNLDGETNLKHKTINKTIIKIFSSHAKAEFNYQEKVVFDYEAPNPYLYTFNGSITTKTSERIPLDSNNFILRGCSLRNTNWIYGVIAYTGHETKIMLNSVKARPKKSKVERMMGHQILLIFCFQILLCLFCALYYSIWFEKNEKELSYLHVEGGTKDSAISYNIGTRFGNWIIIFSNFVPISLLVTLEMVKFFQGILISKDPKMMHESSNTPTNVQSSNLNEELGQVEYIFSDKTGTLTQNYMEFRKLIAQGRPFGLDRSIKDISSFPQVTNVNFLDQSFFDAIKKNDKDVDEYLMALGVCHTIITETKQNEIIYNASSPDELALVNFAKYCGCEYIGMDENGRMVVSYKQKKHKFKLLQVLEFNSKRKRMSVIVEDEKGKILLYCKGADSILLELMDRAKNPETEQTLQHLMEFADEGLRTLLVCYKTISKSDYDAWAKRYLNACVATENRLEKMEVLQEEIEKDLLLIGATAIEDKLQDEVGSTIDFLKRAGIKVWVLTGDKIETAINIGFSCNLLNKELERLVVDGKTYEEVEKSLEEANKDIEEAKKEGDPLKFALIVSGDALIQSMKEPLSTQMMNIANICDAVLCCRVAPKQKAEVVQLVRKTKPNVSTLAIGDGANDVNMITAAHVGVGIRGVEGQQASRASDYAIGEFKLLKRLLVYHGRECYRKNCNLILYNFFKNIILVLPLFWIGFNMVFSGQRVYENWLYSLFNVFYASLPIIIYALGDREYADDSLLKYPFLYQPGIQCKGFNKKRFGLWCLNAMCQSVIIGILSVYILESNFVNKDGRVMDLWCSGALILGLCVTIANFKILTFSHGHSFLSLGIIAGSIAIYVLSIALVNYVASSDLHKRFQDLFSVANFYFGNIVIIFATSLMDYGQERHGMLTERKRVKVLKKAQDAATQVADEVIRVSISQQQPQQISATPQSKPSKEVLHSEPKSPQSKTPKNIKSPVIAQMHLAENIGEFVSEVNTPTSTRKRNLVRHYGYAFSEEEHNFKAFIKKEHYQN